MENECSSRVLIPMMYRSLDQNNRLLYSTRVIEYSWLVSRRQWRGWPPHIYFSANLGQSRIGNIETTILIDLFHIWRLGDVESKSTHRSQVLHCQKPGYDGHDIGWSTRSILNISPLRTILPLPAEGPLVLKRTVSIHHCACIVGAVAFIQCGVAAGHV